MGIIYMSKHVRSRASKSMRIKAIYPGSEALFALWSSLPRSLYLATLTLSSLYCTWAEHRSLYGALLCPSLPLFPPPPPTSLIKGWVEGSRMWRWPPAEACSLILKGRHVGFHPPSSPSLSLKLPPPAWPVRCVQPGAAFPHSLFSCPLYFTPSCEAVLCTAKCTGLGCFTLER